MWTAGVSAVCVCIPLHVFLLCVLLLRVAALCAIYGHVRLLLPPLSNTVDCLLRAARCTPAGRKRMQEPEAAPAFGRRQQQLQQLLQDAAKSGLDLEETLGPLRCKVGPARGLGVQWYGSSAELAAVHDALAAMQNEWLCTGGMCSFCMVHVWSVCFHRWIFAVLSVLMPLIEAPLEAPC